MELSSTSPGGQPSSASLRSRVTASAFARGVIGFPMLRRICTYPAHGSAGMSSGSSKSGFARARFTKEALAFLVLVVLDGLGANLAGVCVVFGRGADLAGVPDWQG